ncbi:hypothetical protein BC831DRAFT_488500 [Entophlyctis helioformis]|nr:hypothetical protein BC831DRAFT_488500 [Entophlyctis helioformis]
MDPYGTDSTGSGTGTRSSGRGGMGMGGMGGGGGAGSSSDPFFERKTSSFEDDEWGDGDGFDPAGEPGGGGSGGNGRSGSAQGNRSAFEPLDSVPAIDYYGILNVERSATDDEIKVAYKRLSLTFHPDKFMDETEKLNAQKKFQTVQRAYDILSDQNKRHIYDLYGESAVDQTWDLGPRLKSKEEIREEFERRARIKREMDAQNLVKSRGEIMIELDATSVLEQRPKLTKFRGPRMAGLPVARKRTFSDMILMPELRQFVVSHAWETKLSHQTNLVLNGSVAARNGIGNGAVNATVRHVVSPLMWGEATAVISTRPAAHVKLVRNFESDVFTTVTGSMTTLSMPPHLRFVAGRQLTSHSTGFVSYDPGLFSIASWGAEDPDVLGHSSCTMGVVHRLRGREWGCEIKAGVVESHVSINHTRPMPGHIRARVEMVASTGGGVRLSVTTDRRIDRNTRVGMGIHCGSSGGVSLRLRVSRLGQRFSIPIFLSSDPNFRLAFFAFTIPLLTGMAADRLVLYPWRQQRIAKSIERVRIENAEALDERRRDGMQAIDLMRESVARRVEMEESRNGLVIIQALYGKLPPSELTSVRALSPQGIKGMAAAIRKQITSVLTPSLSALNLDPSASSSALPYTVGADGALHTDPADQPPQPLLPQEDWIDVTIPVQALVSNGQLHVGGGYSKSNIIGFWDPCFGEKKRLRITYQFQGRIHQVEVDDRAPVAAPLRAHIV